MLFLIPLDLSPMTLETLRSPRELFEAHRGLAIRLANRYRAKAPGWIDADDLRQECKIALMRAAEHFNPAQGHAFPSYALVVISRAARAFVRREYRQGFSGLGKPVAGADPQVRSQSYDTAALAEIVPDASSVPAIWKQERWDEVLRCLTPRERQVVERRLFHDATNRDIGAALGICVSRVHFLWQSAIRRIKVSAHGITDLG